LEQLCRILHVMISTCLRH